MRVRSSYLALIAIFASVPLRVLAACGDDASEQAPPAAAAIEHVHANPRPGALQTTPAEASPPTEIRDASCIATVESPSFPPATHLPEGTPIGYTSNPPAGGPHYPVWANFQEFATPVPDGYLVHSMEHGAVLLLYKCDALDTAAGTCNEVVDALRAIRDGVATDPTCDPSIRVRVILAPRPALDVPIAAAAWGNTYKADCLNVATLTEFVTEHYAKGPEDFCAAGKTSF